MMEQRLLHRALRPLALRLRHLLAFGAVRLSNSQAGTQDLQVSLLRGEVRDRVPHLENYGFTARPLEGAEALVGSLGGLREQPVALVVGDRRFRVQGLSEGEVAIYTDEGDLIHLRRDGRMLIQASGDVQIVAPDGVEIDGDLKVNGDIGDLAGGLGTTMAEIRARFDAHIHQTATGPTSGPNNPFGGSGASGDGPGSGGPGTGGGSNDLTIDGGSATSVYMLPEQSIDGGGA